MDPDLRLIVFAHPRSGSSSLFKILQLHPAQTKLNSAATYAWLPNAAEIDQSCGNSATGWLDS